MPRLSPSQKVAKLARDGLGVCITPILVVGIACVSAAVFVLDKMDSKTAHQNSSEVAEEKASTLAS